MIAKNISGRFGEKKAVEHLEKMGYRILFHSYRAMGAEIDIIAADGDVLCFVEVKTRKNKDFGYASQAVNRRKQQKMILGARCFLNQNKMYHTFRFDVIEVYGEVGCSGFCVSEINHIKNAFEA